MKQIDYLKFMSQKVIDASIEDEPIIHNLSGGTFTLKNNIENIIRDLPPIIGAGILIMQYYEKLAKLKFSDHCDCKTKNKCNKVLPIILSNN